MVEIATGPNLVTAGSFILSWHGLFSFIAVATAVYLVLRWGPMRGIDPDIIYSIAIWAIIGGVLGARLVHVVDSWEELYRHNPVRILYIWSGGIGVWGGILGGFIGGTLYALWAKHPVGIIADLTAPALLFVQTIGRLGDIVNGEHCAKVADFALGFKWTHAGTNAAACANGVATSIHPVIAYEMVWNLVALYVVWRLRGRLRPDGMLFALYLALYSVGRLLISFGREDKVWALGLVEAQYIALVVLAITVPLLVVKARFTERDETLLAVAQPVRQSGTRAERRRRRR